MNTPRLPADPGSFPVTRMRRNRRTDWSRRLTEKGVMNAPVRDYSELLGDAHVKSTELIHWFEQPGFARVPLARVPGADVDWALPAPALGEHNEEILTELKSPAGGEA